PQKPFLPVVNVKFCCNSIAVNRHNRGHLTFLLTRYFLSLLLGLYQLDVSPLIGNYRWSLFFRCPPRWTPRGLKELSQRCRSGRRSSCQESPRQPMCSTESEQLRRCV